MSLSKKRIKELEETFDRQVLSFQSWKWDDEKQEEVVSWKPMTDAQQVLESSWGGYSNMCSWPGSCGNQEWCAISDNELGDFRDGEEVAHWLKLMKKAFKKYRLGNLFLSFPCSVTTGKPLKRFSKIGKAVKLLRMRRLTRAINPNHTDHFQDVYLLVKDNY